MSVSGNVLTGEKPKEKYFLAFFIAFVVACGLFIPYIIWDEGYFIFYGDFNVQQIPFYKLAHAAVRNLDIGWDFGTDLGANFVSSYSFYLLGSPFFWLTLPFPNSFVPHLMGPLLILKFSCASLTAYAFITRFVSNKYYAVLGGFMYAFSGFSVYNIFFNHFHEAMIYFPLILLGLELIMSENRRGFFFCAVSLSLIANYYFFFGMVIFTVIYFVVRWASGSWNISFKRGEAAYTCSRFLGVIIESVLGLLAGMVILFPSVLGIVQNTRVGSMLTGWNGLVYDKPQLYPYIFQSFFFPPDLPARLVFFNGSEKKWASVAGWLPLFGMTGVISWLQVKKKTWQRRLIIICIFIALIPLLNQMFSAFNYNYYARWFYMPVLIMSLMTVMAFEDKSIDLNIGLRWSALITGAIILLVGFMPAKRDGEGNITEFGVYNKSYTDRFWIYCGIAAACLVIVYLLLRLKKKSAKMFTRAALVMCCAVSLLYSSYVVFLGTLVRSNDKTFIIPTLIENDRQLTVTNAQGKLELATDLDDARIDIYEATQNTAMFLGIRSIQAFQSIVPGSVMDFYNYTAFSRTVNSNPNADIYALRGLLSVKYVINYTDEKKQFYDEGKYVQPGYKLYSPTGEASTKEDTEQSGYYVYENNNFVPYGFTYDYYMTKSFCDEVEKEKRSNAMMKAILLDEEQIEKYGDILTDISSQTDIDGFEDSLNYHEYTEDCKNRAANACSSFSTGKSEFTAKITLDRDNLVFFSVPYEKGWTATVDGQPVDVERVNMGFMAVRVEGDGAEHTIRFTYQTPGLKAGAVISVFALLCFGIYMIYFKIKKPKAPDFALNTADEPLNVMDFSQKAEIYGSEHSDGGEAKNSEEQPAPTPEGEKAADNLEKGPQNDRTRTAESLPENGENPNENVRKDCLQKPESQKENAKNIFIKKDERND